jgi:predicted RNA binding protein YcfA (HicA-like mRNA interferase family)
MIDRNSMVRFLTNNGFVELPRKSSGHRYFSRDGVKVTLLGHGCKDVRKQHVAAILREMEQKLGLDRQQMRKELGN